MSNKKTNHRNFTTYTPLKPFPKPPFNTPAPQPSIPQAGTFLQTIKEGFAAGVGVNIATRVIDSVLGPRKVEIVHTNQAECDTLRAKWMLSNEEKEKLAQCEKK